MKIPIFIVCYNNGLLVRNSVNNVKKFNQPVIIIDNCSTFQETIDILQELEQHEEVNVLRYNDNKGPWRVMYDDEFKDVRKQPFILTDPDLGLETLPDNAVEILFEVQEKYQVQKVGLALDISNPDDFIDGYYCSHEGENYDITTWESRFWKHQIQDDKYDIYQADIDTTFCLINFNYTVGALRVAGDKGARNLTVKHFPWHKSFVDNLSIEQIKQFFHNPTISTSAKLVWRHKQI